MIAVLCNNKGVRPFLGSDGVIRVDGRLSLFNQVDAVRSYRAGFRKYFRHKHDEWTHCYFVKSVRDMPASCRGRLTLHKL